MLIHPRRTATLATRLDSESVREALRPIVETAAQATGSFGWREPFVGGQLGERDFHFAYRFTSPANPQTYDIHGTIDELKPGWRVVRLEIRARTAWLSPLTLGAMALLLALCVFVGRVPIVPALAIGVGVVLVYAFVNLLYLPDHILSKVSDAVESRIRG